MSRDDADYSLVDIQRLRERRQRQSSPDSDPNELKRKLRERDEADDEKRDERIEKLEAAVAQIDKSLDTFKAEIRAMLRAYGGALGALIALVGMAITLVVKFWR